MKNYDPNNGFGMHTVELVFQQWGYKYSIDVYVKGNCKGFSIIQAALDSFFDELYNTQGEHPVLYFTDEDGKSLEYDVDLDDDEDFRNALVSAKILGFTKD